MAAITTLNQDSLELIFAKLPLAELQALAEADPRNIKPVIARYMTHCMRVLHGQGLTDPQALSASKKEFIRLCSGETLHSIFGRESAGSSLEDLVRDAQKLYALIRSRFAGWDGTPDQSLKALHAAARDNFPHLALAIIDRVNAQGGLYFENNNTPNANRVYLLGEAIEQATCAEQVQCAATLKAHQEFPRVSAYHLGKLLPSLTHQNAHALLEELLLHPNAQHITSQNLASACVGTCFRENPKALCLQALMKYPHFNEVPTTTLQSIINCAQNQVAHPDAAIWSECSEKANAILVARAHA